jgi:hypothetical protein
VLSVVKTYQKWRQECLIYLIKYLEGLIMNKKERKKLIKQLKPYWATLTKIRDKFYNKIYRLKQKMEKETGIKYIEFFVCDDGYVGVGSGEYDKNGNRVLPLIHDWELEE